MTVKNVFAYTLFVNGLFGKNRKVKHDNFVLAQDCEQALTPGQVKALAEEKIASLKVKMGTWRMTEQPVVLDTTSGYAARSFKLFTDKEVLSGRVNFTPI